MRDGLLDQDIRRWVEGGPQEEGDHTTDTAVPYNVNWYDFPEDASAGSFSQGTRKREMLAASGEDPLGEDTWGWGEKVVFMSECWC